MKKEKPELKIQEAMKPAASASPSSSSVKSSTTFAAAASAAAMEDEETSCYFPGCRKDANCDCKICFASFNATLDLMPASNQRSTITKFSSSKPARRSPVSFNPSVMSTPTPVTRKVPKSPVAGSTTASSDFGKEEVKKTRDNERGYGFMFLSLALGVSLILGAEFGFQSVVSVLFRPKLSSDVVTHVGEKSRTVQDLRGRLEYLQDQLQQLVDGKISNCSSGDSSWWKVNKDGLLLSSRCVLFKSAAEEVSIWGWPLQTAGLLASEFSSTSLTILSGRVTEWSNGKFSYSIRTRNSSWVQRRWSASAVQLDPNTWILEYRPSLVLENSRLFSAFSEFFKLWMSRVVGSLKQEFWQTPGFLNLYNDLMSENAFKAPT